MKRLIAFSLVAGGLSGCILAGCASVEQVSAAGDVHAFLIAIRDNDRQAFSQYVDKPALSRELEARIDDLVRSRTEDKGGRFVGALLAGPLGRTAVDAAVRPDVFRAVAVSFGYSPDKPIPGQFAIAEALRPAGDNQVCAAKGRGKPCLLTFTREDDRWKLTYVDIGSLKL